MATLFLLPLMRKYKPYMTNTEKYREKIPSFKMTLVKSCQKSLDIFIPMFMYIKLT